MRTLTTTASSRIRALAMLQRTAAVAVFLLPVAASAGENVAAFTAVRVATPIATSAEATRTTGRKLQMEPQAAVAAAAAEKEQHQREGSNQIVRVEISRDLPRPSSSSSSSSAAAAISPQQAREAWLDFVWKGGGGLPTIVVSLGEGGGGGGDDDGKSENRRRLLLPYFMEEELVDDDDDGDCYGDEEGHQSVSQKYRVSKWGLNPDVVPDSHLGIVEFVSDAGGGGSSTATKTKMKWTAEFEVVGRRGLWQAVSEALIGSACDNFVSYLSPPIVYRRTTVLPNVTPQQAMEAWLDFVWKQGGGLPTPLPPLSLPSEPPTTMTRIIAPPFLKESVLTADSSDSESSVVEYQVDNPGLWTCYPVHTHRGQVRFERAHDDSSTAAAPADNTMMVWEVCVRPYNGLGGYVRAFTSAVVTTLARNLKSHVRDGPGAVVSVKPPRGRFGGKSLFQVRKDTWLGGVLDAHLSDQRSTLDQTLAMSQPWTWGRSTDDDIREGEEWKTIEAT